MSLVWNELMKELILRRGGQTVKIISRWQKLSQVGNELLKE